MMYEFRYNFSKLKVENSGSLMFQIQSTPRFWTSISQITGVYPPRYFGMGYPWARSTRPTICGQKLFRREMGRLLQSKGGGGRNVTSTLDLDFSNHRSLPTQIFWHGLPMGKFYKTHYMWAKAFQQEMVTFLQSQEEGGWYFDFGPRFLKSQEFTHPDFWYELPIGYPCQTTWPGKPL